MKLRRWTPRIFPVPDRDEWWRPFDFEGWSGSTYEWTADPWNGYRDFTRRRQDCVASGRDDCEDYALVALASAVARGRDGVGVGVAEELYCAPS